ncbi:hypothetical protein TKK_0011530 [Trichogramma kaykai]
MFNSAVDLSKEKLKTYQKIVGTGHLVSIKGDDNTFDKNYCAVRSITLVGNLIGFNASQVHCLFSICGNLMILGFRFSHRFVQLSCINASSLLALLSCHCLIS